MRALGSEYLRSCFYKNWLINAKSRTRQVLIQNVRWTCYQKYPTICSTKLPNWPKHFEYVVLSPTPFPTRILIKFAWETVPKSFVDGNPQISKAFNIYWNYSFVKEEHGFRKHWIFFNFIHLLSKNNQNSRWANTSPICKMYRENLQLYCTNIQLYNYLPTYINVQSL